MKKKKKKQEPIFSNLEEIKIAPTEKNNDQQANAFEIKAAEEKTTVRAPEPVSVLPSEPLAEALLSPVVSLPDGQEITSPEKKEAQVIAISCEPKSAGTLPPDSSATTSLTTAISLPPFSFVFISPGTFIMGSPETELGRTDDELPHEVSITHGSFLQTTPVTQGQWKAVMGNNPSRFSPERDDHPVESVSWYDCQKFIERLNSSGEHIYRLPTEAEWEYACRTGKFSSCSEGEIVELFCDHDPNLDAVGWYCGNSDRATHLVARKKPNPWGLYDLHGNVLEWCQDWYGPYPATPQTDPTGPITGPGRVIRGGSWFSNAKSCRSAARFYWAPNAKSDFIGFRLVREEKDNRH